MKHAKVVSNSIALMYTRCIYRPLGIWGQSELIVTVSEGPGKNATAEVELTRRHAWDTHKARRYPRHDK